MTEPSTIKNILRDLRECLDNITLKELSFNQEIQEALTDIQTTISDYFMLLNPKNRNLFINLKTKTEGKDRIK